MVRRTFRNLDIADFRLIYKTYIRPQMELCIQAWSPHFVKDIDTPYGPRGHEKKLAKDRSRLDSRKFFFSQRVVNEWNSLPAKVVNSESVNSFKNAYDRYYWTTEADQLPVHQPTSTTTSKYNILTLDHCSLSHRSSSSTQRFCRAGQLATADTRTMYKHVFVRNTHDTGKCRRRVLTDSGICVRPPPLCTFPGYTD